MLEDPSSEHGWQVDQDCLDEVAEAIQEAIDMPTAGAPAVVTLCTDGARGALVRLPQLCPPRERLNAVRW